VSTELEDPHSLSLGEAEDCRDAGRCILPHGGVPFLLRPGCPSSASAHVGAARSGTAPWRRTTPCSPCSLGTSPTRATGARRAKENSSKWPLHARGLSSVAAGEHRPGRMGSPTSISTILALSSQDLHLLLNRSMNSRQH
jgi:hypothetical protein